MAKPNPRFTAPPIRHKSLSARIADAVLDPGGEWITTSAPVPVKLAILMLASKPRSDRDIAIITRIASDRRLDAVWRELMRRDRRSGTYFHPAIPQPDDAPAPAEDAQARAIGELVFATFNGAAAQVRVSKPADIARMVAELRAKAAMLRELAADPGNEADAAALLRVAERLDAQIDTRRRVDDPLVIENDRGDPTLRGLTIVLADHLLHRFGARLEGTAATLAAVALGVATQHRRAARPAFSRQKRRKETDC